MSCRLDPDSLSSSPVRHGRFRLEVMPPFILFRVSRARRGILGVHDRFQLHRSKALPAFVAHGPTTDGRTTATRTNMK